MDLAEWSRVGLLGIIIVKNRARAADRLPSASTERERFGGSRLLAHDVGEERRGGGGNGGHFWGICSERGADGIRGRAIGTVRGDRARTEPVVTCGID
jgi:hypothetical protein